ncbi:hypothetical protein A6P54_14515 [Bacillus sp. MKU004]|nr:hypothetical protein A6P54_14515 [Bacillus sp. MKU004]
MKFEDFDTKLKDLPFFLQFYLFLTPFTTLSGSYNKLPTPFLTGFLPLPAFKPAKIDFAI